MTTMEPTALQQFISLASSHAWLPLIMFVTLYLRKILSPASGFPITIPPKWLPTVSAVAGLVYGVELSRSSGQSWEVAILGAVVGFGSAGALDGVMTAIFDHDNAPAWFRAIVFVFDDVTKGGGGGAGSTKLRMLGGKAFSAPPTIVVTPPSPPANPYTSKRASRYRRVGFAGLISAAALHFSGVVGCTPAAWANFVTVEAQFVNYVQTFLDGAQALWAIVLPLIPASNQAEADTAFQDGVLALNQTLAALQNAVNAGVAAQQAPADYPTLVANVQAAVANLVTIVEKWQPVQFKEASVATFSEFEQQAQVIKAWK